MSQQATETQRAAGAPGRPAAAPGARRAGSRRRFFIACSLLLPVVVLAALEGVLRLAGYGGYAPTFRAAGRLDDGSTLVFTDHAGPASYFFANRSSPGTLDPVALVMPKPAGTVRIMLVGESAAKGIPQPRALSSSAFLRAMLADVWPDRTVEVINLGTTAIASYPALGILTEALEYEPDLVVVYVGNNEYYGAYGVASLHSAGQSPGAIRLIRAFRSLAIAQFIDRRLAASDNAPGKTLIEAMVGQSSIGPAHGARRAAPRNLGVFMGDMLDRCRARGVPAIVCTPPCNERDLAPLGGPDASGIDAGAHHKVADLLGSSRAALAQDPAGAADLLRQLLGIAPDHAPAHFFLGRALYAMGHFDGAAAEFRRAVDLDTMPWRPPSSSVDAIRTAALTHGAVLCDLEAAFRAASPGGSVGWELMDDHVHPSLRGQDLVARALVRAAASVDGRCRVEAGAADALPDFGFYRDRLGANSYDAYGVAHAMRVLGAVPFFARTNPEMWERNEAICREIWASSPPEVVRQLLEWQTVPVQRGERRPISGMAGRALMDLGRAADAAAVFRVAAGSVMPYSSWDLEYTWLMLTCRRQASGRLDSADQRAARDAGQRGRFLIATGRSTTGQAERFTGQLHQLLGEFDASIPLLVAARAKLSGANRVAADRSLIDAYVATGRAGEARRIIDEGARSGGENADLYRRMLPLPQGP